MLMCWRELAKAGGAESLTRISKILWPTDFLMSPMMPLNT
jgi:hypothetical protein